MADPPCWWFWLYVRAVKRQLDPARSIYSTQENAVSSEGLEFSMCFRLPQVVVDWTVNRFHPASLLLGAGPGILMEHWVMAAKEELYAKVTPRKLRLTRPNTIKHGSTLDVLLSMGFPRTRAWVHTRVRAHTPLPIITVRLKGTFLKTKLGPTFRFCFF